MRKLWKSGKNSLCSIFFLPLMALLAGSSLFLASCQTNPETGKKEFNIISPEREIAMGKSFRNEIRKEWKAYPNRTVQEYVDRVGHRVARHAAWQQPDYSFTVIKDSDINAFALPGGPVYITTGLLSKMENEAQLAGVLAHETGHISARHHSVSLSRQFGFSAAVNIALAVTTEGKSWNSSSETRKALGLFTNLVENGFSREDELEADSLGLRYMTKARYNPDGLVQVFHILAQHGGSAGGLGQIFSTHPSERSRIDNAKDLIHRHYFSAINNPNYTLGRDQFISNTAPLR